MTVFLKYNDFQDRTLHLVRNLRYDSDSYDVSLIAGNEGSRIASNSIESCNTKKYNQMEGAHKFILMESSGRFKRILSQMRSQPKPCIYLHGVSEKCLRSLLDFMYLGQIELMTQRELKEFMEIAKEFEISANVCFGKSKHPIPKQKDETDSDKTSKRKRLSSYDPSHEEVIKIPKLQKDACQLTLEKNCPKQIKKPTFKIKIRPFNIVTKKIQKHPRRCSKIRNGNPILKNDKGLHFYVCPIVKCGRMLTRIHNVKSHFDQSHPEKVWADWESKSKKYAKADYATGPMALFIFDETLKMHRFRKSCKQLNFHDNLKVIEEGKTENEVSTSRSVLYDEFYPCPILECGIIMGKSSRKRHFQRQHPNHLWEDWSEKWRSYDPAAYKDGPTALFTFDDQSKKYEIRKVGRSCNFHSTIGIRDNSLSGFDNATRETKASNDSDLEESINIVLKKTVLRIPRIAINSMNSKIEDQERNNQKSIHDNIQPSVDIFE